MQVPSTSSLTYLLLALVSFQAASASSVIEDVDSLDARQEPLVVSCDEYAVLSNLTAIGTNSTFRASFIQASPDGTLKSSMILNEAAAKWTSLALINDTALNDECGNLSAIALEEAPLNFSKGIAGPYNMNGAARHGGSIGASMIGTGALVGAAFFFL